MAALTPLPEALSAILADCVPKSGDEQCLPLAAALGRTVASSYLAAIDVPAADNSAMDGYAVRFADLADYPDGLVVAQRLPAGKTGGPLQTGTAARIFTGADIPPGADTVLLQEQVKLEGDRIVSTVAVNPGQHIRRRGQDLAIGDLVVTAGRRLSGPDLGLLASVGIATVNVRPRLRVALICTGDELVEPGVSCSNWAVIASMPVLSLTISARPVTSWQRWLARISTGLFPPAVYRSARRIMSGRRSSDWVGCNCGN